MAGGESRVLRHGGGRGSVWMNLDFAPTFESVGENVKNMSGAASVAMMRTLRQLKTKIKSEGVKAAAATSGTPQKYWRRSMRAHAALDALNIGGVTFTSGVVTLWLGTNPVPVHRLGPVRWTRRMKGARVSRKRYPGTWSWGPGSATGPAVMRRDGDERLTISREEMEPHDSVLDRMASLGPEMQEWFARRLKQQLNYALEVEAKTPSWGAKAKRRIRIL